METAAVSGRDEHEEFPDVTRPVAVPALDTWAAFSDFYTAQHPRMVRVAFLLTGSSETAQDVVQDSFVRVYSRWDKVRDPAGYMYRTVVNGCRSQHRRSNREQRVRDRIAQESAVTLTPLLGADDLRDALAALPYRQRAALVLRFYDDLSESEAAAALACR